MIVFSPAWWVAAGQRAAYTALAAVLPLAALLFTGDHTIPLAKVEDVAALRKAGVPQADVTADTYNRVAQATAKEN